MDAPREGKGDAAWGAGSKGGVRWGGVQAGVSSREGGQDAGGPSVGSERRCGRRMWRTRRRRWRVWPRARGWWERLHNRDFSLEIRGPIACESQSNRKGFWREKLGVYRHLTGEDVTSSCAGTFARLTTPVAGQRSHSASRINHNGLSASFSAVFCGGVQKSILPEKNLYLRMNGILNITSHHNFGNT